MTDDEIDELAARIKGGERFIWNPDTETCYVITSVGPEPPPKEGDTPEPSLVAYLAGAGFGPKFIALWNVDPDEIFSFQTFKAYEGERKGGCPCEHVQPCKDTCSCANPIMSGGCMRCATYGSPEQQERAAAIIAETIDTRRDGTIRLVLQTHDGDKWNDTSVQSYSEWRMPRLLNYRDHIRKGGKQSRLMRRIECEIPKLPEPLK